MSIECGNIGQWVRYGIRSLASGPARFLTPAVATVAAIAVTVSGYSPLVYQSPAVAEGSENLSLLDAPDEKESKVAKAPSSDFSPAGELQDGVWTGYAECAEDGVFDYYLALDVTVKDGEVTNISNLRGSATGNEDDPQKAPYSASDNDAYLNKASNSVVTQLLSDAKDGTISTSVDAVSGATYSSYSILSAYHDALTKAGGSASKSEETPAAPKKKKTRAKSDFDANTKFADGVWTGYDVCAEEDIFDYYLALDVTIKDGKVTSISNVRGSATGNEGDPQKEPYSAEDNDVYLERASDNVVSQLLSDGKKGVISSSIDVVSGATYSSNSILDAYYDALKKAAAAAGSNASIPASKDDGATDDDSANDDADDKDNSSQADEVDSDTVVYTDGIYTAYAYCEDVKNTSAYSPYYLGVTVEVVDGVVNVKEIFGDAEGIVNPIYKYDAGENKRYLDRAINGYGISGKHPGVLKQITDGIADGKVFKSYDTISGATYSSESIIEAYRLALEMAEAESEDSDMETNDGEMETSDGKTVTSVVEGEATAKGSE